MMDRADRSKLVKKRLFWALLFLALLTGCGRFSTESRPVDGAATAVAAEGDTTPTPRPTRPVPKGTTILADGQLVAVNPVASLSFNGAGRLLTIEAAPGDKVNEGDLIATLDDENLREAMTNAELQMAQAELSLAQAQLTLDDLLNWAPEETAVAVAEANLAAAEASLEQAQTADASAGNSLTAARINLNQAERALADAQKAYDTAFDPGREWEMRTTNPTCFPGEGGPIPCTGPSLKSQLEAEQDGVTRGLAFAQENLQVAQAQYNLAAAGLNNDTAVSAQANVISARQTLEQATTGPKEKEIAVARLSVEQAELSLQQSQLSLEQAQNALAGAQLTAPWSGVVLTVDASSGSMVGAGAPIVTLLDTETLQFHTSNLSERDLAQIEPGQPVEITLKTYANQPVTGVVARIAPQASGAVGDAAVFTVMIDLTDTADLDLRPGMTGRVEIVNESE